VPRSGSFVPIRHSRYYTTLLTPKMYLRNTHLVSFTKVEGLSVPYIVDVYEFLAREPWVSVTYSCRAMFTDENGYLNKVWYLHIYTHTYLRAMPTTQRTNTYTTRSDRQFDLWRIIILCSLAYILLPASIILCPERISAFSSNEGMDLPFVRTKIAGQMCHDAILTRKMRTTCVDISVLRLNSYE